jgi:HlyD family secretion protein
MVMCASLLISLPLVHVDVTVQERGRIRPAAERSVIVARTAGVISSVRVHDNDLVHVGDTLLTLSSRALDAKVDFNREQTEQVRQELADLDYLLDCVCSKKPVSIDGLQTARYIAAYQKFDTDCRNADLKRDRTAREMDRIKRLFADKVVSTRDFDEASYQANAVRVEREVIYRQTVAQWQADKVQKNTELEHLKSEARQLAEERNMYSVIAPVDGVVIGVQGLFDGSYVQSGQKIGEISPTGDFVMDVAVPPKDIGRIFNGQSVKIQVDAFPYTVWGLLPGRVIRISADYIQDSAINSGFKVVVQPDRDYLETREGVKGLLKKGMTVNARFFVARRSLWELLYESLDKNFDPAMHEDLSPRNVPSKNIQAGDTGA